MHVVSQTQQTLTIACPAKVNLFLEVLGKRADGYHELQTLILLINLYDTLTVTSTATPGFICTSNIPSIPTDERNLVVKAAMALQRESQRVGGLTAHLQKRIPHEAGLGGGSSNAAMALWALNRLWSCHLEPKALQTIAGTVGSDVAAFLSTPATWCTGRGETVESQPLGGVFHFVLVKPPLGCPTGQVYAHLQPSRAPHDAFEARKAVEQGDPERLARGIFNRLENAAFAVAPELRLRYDRLLATTPLCVWVTGSGSSVVGLCRDAAHAMHVEAEYRSHPVAPEDRIIRAQGLSP